MMQPNEYHPYYQTYIDKTVGLTIGNLRSNFQKVLDFLNAIPIDKQEYSYAPGKWSIKEVVLHIIDTERIFSYRALCIARKDQTPLPGFDQDVYVAPGRANQRSMESLLNEYVAVKASTITLFESFDDEMLMQIGTASFNPISVRAIAHIIMGHENHHCDIIKDRYL